MHRPAELHTREAPLGRAGWLAQALAQPTVGLLLLIVGQMASWTRIYPPHLIARYFVLEAQYGDYDIYRRLR